jgi:hypothetical protein
LGEIHIRKIQTDTEESTGGGESLSIILGSEVNKKEALA